MEVVDDGDDVVEFFLGGECNVDVICVGPIFVGGDRRSFSSGMRARAISRKLGGLGIESARGTEKKREGEV